MRPKIAIIYNQPDTSYHSTSGEDKAELSIIGNVRAVQRALNGLGYAVIRVPISPPLENVREKLKKMDTNIVFNLFEGFHGYSGAEAEVAFMMSELGLVNTGCPGSILSLALDKAKTKAIMQSTGIATPEYQVLTPDMLTEFNLQYPCIVKPCGEDASHGLNAQSVVRNADQLEKQVTEISKHFGGKALVEEFIDGREFNVTAIGNGTPTIFPVTEIVYSLPAGKPKILTFDAKWYSGTEYFIGTKPVCPAKITPQLKSDIQDIAVKVFKRMNCFGYIRVDLRLDSNGKVKVLEINPNPDLTPGNGAARQAKALGMNFQQFIDYIVQLAFQVHGYQTDYQTYGWQGQAGYNGALKEYA